MAIRARAPLRIGFGGGGTDVPPYCEQRGGVVLNATINRYACATLIPQNDRISVRSLDYDASISYGIDDPFIYDGQLDLAKGVLDHIRREHGLNRGFEIILHNDAPPGSGLGSSSAIAVALIAAIGEYLKMPFDSYQIADMAYRIERIELAQKGGKQDQYAATFGGFNFIEFKDETVVVNSLRLRPETIYELEYSMVFAYVGGQRFSSNLIDKQVASYSRGDEDVIGALDKLKSLAYEMKQALLLGKLRDFGELMNIAWTAKQKTASGISTPTIDNIYNQAREAGALGGKITGAGGGGYMFFMCDPNRRFAVQEALRTAGAQVVNFSFVEQGVRTWQVE